VSRSDTTRGGAGSDDWDQGWWRLARRCPSPNFNDRPAGVAVSLIVIHSISLPPGEFGGDSVERLFSNRLDWDAHPYFELIRGLRVSSHFLIRRDAACVQFVSCNDRAWHAGVSSWRGQDNCNDYSVGIELEGLEGGTFEPVQYAALRRLLQAVRAIYPIVSVAGHEHVAPGRKADPGPGFCWAELTRDAGWPTQCFPESALGSTRRQA
jgi:AmpD protein